MKKLILFLWIFLVSCSYHNIRSFNQLIDEPIYITITNNNWNDADVYVYWNGVKNRVGFVVGKTKRTLKTDWKDYNLQLEIDFVGDNKMMSETIDVNPGDHIDYVILPQW